MASSPSACLALSSSAGWQRAVADDRCLLVVLTRRCREEGHMEGLRGPKGDPRWKPDLNPRGLSCGPGGLAAEAPLEGMQVGAA